MKSKKQQGEASDATAAAPAPAPAPVPSVDQIRDIIFGQQMQQYEQRFSALEQKLLAEAQAIRDDLKKNFTELTARLTEERDVREQAAADFHKLFEDKVNELAQHAARDRDSLEQALASARDDIQASLDNLTHVKTDREALSTLLRDVASQLENGSTGSAKG